MNEKDIDTVVKNPKMQYCKLIYVCIYIILFLQQA